MVRQSHVLSSVILRQAQDDTCRRTHHDNFVTLSLSKGGFRLKNCRNDNFKSFSVVMSVNRKSFITYGNPKSVLIKSIIIILPSILLAGFFIEPRKVPLGIFMGWLLGLLTSGSSREISKASSVHKGPPSAGLPEPYKAVRPLCGNRRFNVL